MKASLRALVGTWQGNGTGPQGPFDVRSNFEERGRWVLLRHEIFPPGNGQPFYMSSQVFGCNDEGLTLDYFDTAGSFHFRGEKSGSGLTFSWKKDTLWKSSRYEFDDAGTVLFKYQSFERTDENDPKLFEFEGRMTK